MFYSKGQQAKSVWFYERTYFLWTTNNHHQTHTALKNCMSSPYTTLKNKLFISTSSHSWIKMKIHCTNNTPFIVLWKSSIEISEKKDFRIFNIKKLVRREAIVLWLDYLIVNQCMTLVLQCPSKGSRYFYMTNLKFKICW